MDGWRDLRHAWRSLARTPGFALVTLLTIALGIGANTAMFSVLSAVLLKPLPYPHPGQLVYISTQFSSMGFDQFWVSPPEFLELQERAQSFSAIGAFSAGQANLTAPERPRRVNATRVSAELDDALSVSPLLGRWFEPEETRPNGPAVVVLTYELWRSAYGANRNLVGQSVEVNSVRRQVIGVMPPRFDVADTRSEIFIPLSIDPANRQNRGNHYLFLTGRLKDDVTLAAAKAELETLLAAWPSSVARPAANANGPHTPDTQRHRVRFDPLQDQIVGGAKVAILVLQGAVVLVLLIACANIANLLLARAEARHKEFAVRAAIGAGARQLIAPFVAEGLLLTAGGAVLGLVVGASGVRALLVAFPDSLPRSGAVSLDLRVLGLTLIVAGACAATFTLTPLLHWWSSGGAASLKERATTGESRNRIRRALVASEVALAVALVIGAGLLLRTVLNLSRVDAGFNRAQLVTFGISLPPASYTKPEQITAFHQRLLDALRATAGVKGVTLMSGLPPSRQLNANDTDIDGYTAPPGGPFENVDYYQYVVPGYVETMGIPVIDGRAFQPTDVNGSSVLINETMARTFFKKESPIGRRLRCCGPRDQVPWFTIIGVVKDVKQGGIEKKTGTELYFDIDQLPSALPNSMPLTVNVVLRTSLPAAALATTIHRTVAALDSSIPVIRLRTMDEVFADTLGRPRLLAQLLTAFAAVAVLLAAIGTFGVLSYMVSQRRREMGIRMALGAGRATVLRMVLSQGMKLAAVGMVLGIVFALAMNRVLQSLLFGVSPFDAPTIAGVVGLIGLVSLVGCYLPARVATRVDPLIALRDE
jgi:predicted permease